MRLPRGRYGGSPTKGDGAPKAIATLAAIKIEWAALEAAEAGLRAELWRFKVKVQGPALLWERLRRGCQKVSGWLGQVAPVLETIGATASDEGEAYAPHDRSNPQTVPPSAHLAFAPHTWTPRRSLPSRALRRQGGVAPCGRGPPG